MSSKPDTCKINVADRNGRSAPECTACGHRFGTDHAVNPYRETCAIAMGKFRFCPECGARYAGCQINGVDFDRCSADERDWISRGWRPDSGGRIRPFFYPRHP